jgi:hypothetical protein
MAFSNGSVTIPVTKDESLVIIVSLGAATGADSFRGAYVYGDGRPARLAAYLAEVAPDSENLHDEGARTEPSAVVCGRRGSFISGTLTDFELRAQSPLGEAVISLIARGQLSHAAAVQVIPRLLGEALIADDRLIESIEDVLGERRISEELGDLIMLQEDARRR